MLVHPAFVSGYAGTDGNRCVRNDSFFSAGYAYLYAGAHSVCISGFQRAGSAVLSGLSGYDGDVCFSGLLYDEENRKTGQKEFC